ncbi:2-phospho-L-lactate guanylyltransferase [Oscillochloris sp. ZM17-4]|uniref:2-phospho-L-lactate guanylyltransferase n=1 Tax=Oscillochloris sp. ZM17-4 TaxID=2866714 RepID=UPI001C734A50|nr:2-phospho-L-lactate guanylyltransferase [Oscillochloris sp. ZM17-4]MBX0326240.1 2-phospho-L-lactate guanylyltransferase [Oscillochloris sp. ZM17-4]
MQIHAVVPVKALARAKSRLAGRLSIAERHDLVLEMLGRVLGALLACRGAALAEVWVISADPEALALAAACGARTMLDSADGLNGALGQARAALTAAGVAAMLVVPADVPLITAGDVAAMARTLTAGADVAMATDRQGDGTNALGLRLPSDMPFRFGERSAGLHLAEADAHDLLAQVYWSPTLALDVDDPESLARYVSRDSGDSCLHSALAQKVGGRPECRP